MSNDMPGCFSGINFISKIRRISRARANAHSPETVAASGPNTPCKWVEGSSNPAHNDNLDMTHEKYPAMEVLPSYDDVNSNQLYRPEVLDTIEKTIDDLSPQLRKLSLDIHDNPEIAFQEKHAHDALTTFMEKHKFNVTRHYLGLDTAWRAEYEYGAGGRVMGVNSEMDALPGIGHACGHNLIAIAGVAIALALKAALQKHNVPGKVVLLGTPGEEAGNGKVLLLDRGAYKDMAACVMNHPGAGVLNSTGVGPSLAVQDITVEYFGRTAHAAAAPWEGQNAQDAVISAYNAVSVLRQQIKPDQRIHGIIKGNEGWVVNVIPDYAAMHWIVRASSAEELKILKDRVKACILAASLSTACRVKIDDSTIPALDLRQNSALVQDYSLIASQKYGFQVTNAGGAIGGSTDFGNITYAIPAFHPSYVIPTEPNGGNHTILFTKAARTEEAHSLALRVTKALAHTAFRAIDDNAFYNKVQDAFFNE